MSFWPNLNTCNVDSIQYWYHTFSKRLVHPFLPESWAEFVGRKNKRVASSSWDFEIPSRSYLYKCSHIQLLHWEELLSKRGPSSSERRVLFSEKAIFVYLVISLKIRKKHALHIYRIGASNFVIFPKIKYFLNIGGAMINLVFEIEQMLWIKLIRVALEWFKKVTIILQDRYYQQSKQCFNVNNMYLTKLFFILTTTFE